MDRAILLEDRFQPTQRLDGDTVSGMLVDLDHRHTLATGNLDGSDLIAEDPRFSGPLAALLALDRVGILLITADGKLFDQVLGGSPHQLIGHRTVKTVSIHAVYQFSLTEAISLARTQ